MLEDNKKELQEKEEVVDRLDKELNEREELLQRREKEINEKEAQVTELDQTVRECQWELKQRVSEVNFLKQRLQNASFCWEVRDNMY